MKQEYQEKFEELLQEGAARHGYKSFRLIKETKVRTEIYDEAEMKLQSFRDYKSQQRRKKK